MLFQEDNVDWGEMLQMDALFIRKKLNALVILYLDTPSPQYLIK